MDRRHLGAALMACMVVLAGCSYVQNHVVPEVTAIERTDDGYRVEGFVDQRTDAYENTTMHGVSVAAYDPAGTEVCTVSLGDVAGRETPNFSMHCGGFPQLVVVDSADRAKPGGVDENPYATFHWHAVRYDGYDGAKHAWTRYEELDRIGNPPGSAIDADVFADVRCRQRAANVNATIAGDPQWEGMPSAPNVTERYSYTVERANGSVPAGRAGATINTSNALVSYGGIGDFENHLLLASKDDEHGESEDDERYGVVERSIFFPIVSIASGNATTGFENLPAPENASWVTQTDDRTETCYRDPGTYDGSLERTYTFVVEHRAVNEGSPSTAPTTTMVVELSYEQFWRTANANRPACDGTVVDLTGRVGRYCGS